MTTSNPNLARLVILYGTGGLSDVGRHAVAAALEQSDAIGTITVLTKYPELLQEANWKCGCEEPHSFTEEEKKRFQVIPVESWQDEDLSKHFEGATAVISCLGNRQPFIGGWEAEEGNNVVIKALEAQGDNRGEGTKPKHVVVLTSVGIEEDWPPVEFFWGGKLLAGLFMTLSRKSFRDLTQMERAYRSSNLDYVLVRPMGIGEDVKPVGKWYFQKEKYKDIVGFNMAKMDVARYMVEEALQPTRHKEAVTVGAEPPTTEDE